MRCPDRGRKGSKREVGSREAEGEGLVAAGGPEPGKP